MGNSIRLSPEHGVNPSIMICPICTKDTGVALLGLMRNDQEAPRYMYDNKFCDECEAKTKDRVALIQADKDRNRLGTVIFIRDEVFRDNFKGDIVEQVIKQRLVYVEPDVWAMIGVPEEEEK